VSIDQFGDEDLLDPERLKPCADADHVRDRIEPADLVEFHVLDFQAVDFCLSHRETLENSERVLFYKWRQRAAIEHLPDRAMAARRLIVVMMPAVLVFRVMMFMRMRSRMPRSAILILGVDAEFHALDVLARLPLEMHVEIAEPFEFRELPLEGGRFHPKIAEGADRHVAADAGKAIEEKNAHGGLFHRTPENSQLFPSEEANGAGRESF
jgi:hypothetical protein